MLTICQQCGIEFQSAPANKRKFCSRKCMGLSRSKRIPRLCQSCGQEFLAKNHKVKAGQGLYCSRACADTGWDEPCETCGQMVHRTPFHAKRFEHVFCSKQCYHIWHNKCLEYTCKHCGKVFTAKLSAEALYCSLDCRIADKAAKMIELVCEQCGKVYSRKESDLNPNMYQGRFCSNKCRTNSRKIPDSRRSIYSHEFTESLKKQIRQRDKHICRLCGISTLNTYRALDVHHIDYDKTNNHPSNLISLCDSCHIKTNYSREHWLHYFRSL